MLKIKKKDLYKILIGLIALVIVSGVVVYNESKVTAIEDAAEIKKVTSKSTKQESAPVLKEVKVEEKVEEEVIKEEDIEVQVQEPAEEVIVTEEAIEEPISMQEDNYLEIEKKDCWNSGGIWDDVVGCYWPTPEPEPVMTPQITQEEMPSAVMQETYSTPVQESESIEQGCTIVEAPSDGWTLGGSGYSDYNVAWTEAKAYTDNAAIHGTLLRYAVDPVYDTCRELVYYRWVYKAQ